MASLRGARRYAEAIFDLAKDQGRLEGWANDLARLAALAENQAFLTFIRSSKVPLQERLAIAERALPGIHEQALNLLALLATRGRVRLLGRITEEYQRFVNEAQGIEEAEVITAVPLTPNEIESLRSRLEQARGKRVRLSHRQDNTLLGGMILRFGDQLVDGSLRTRLRQMHRAIAGV